VVWIGSVGAVFFETIIFFVLFSTLKSSQKAKTKHLKKYLQQCFIFRQTLQFHFSPNNVDQIKNVDTK